MNSSERGVTIIELMFALAITAIAVTAVTLLVIAAGQMSANAESVAGANDRVRTSGDGVATILRRAGFGAPQGLYVVQGGAPLQIQPVFGVDGTTGNGAATATPQPGQFDDVWLVLPHPNVFRQSCVARGAATSVQTLSSGSLSVRCAGTSLQDGDLLMVSNMKSAALLSGTTMTAATNVTSPASIAFAESAVAGFSNDPVSGGFKVGDMVFPVRLVHLYVGTSNGRPALMRSEGRLGTDPLGRPFVDSGQPTVVEQDIEDFQVAYGFDLAATGNPNTYVWQQGLAPTWTPGLRAVRLAVVARTSKALRNTRGDALEEKKLHLENTTAANSTVASDGRLRTAFVRRIELVNFSARDL